MNAQKRFEIYRRLSIAIPDPSTELNYKSPFELLIAVMLSAQSTDKALIWLPKGFMPWPILLKK